MNHSLGREFTFSSLLSFAFPTMIMMIFTSMYTIVDGIIVSRFIGTDALSAINIVFPAIIITIAIGVMLGTGGSAIIARKLGENKIQEAKEAFTLIVLVGVVIAIIIGFIFILFLEPICQLLGASDLLLEYCKQYLYTLSFFIPALMLQMLFEIFFITAGKPKLGLILIVFAGITNGVLDYVFIVTMNMGITGAALATAIGCLIPSIGGLIYFFNHKNILHFVRPSLKKNVIWASCLNGSSEMVTNLSAGIITWIFNLLMMKHLGENGVAAMTIVLYTQFLMTALFMGFSMGVAPVFSYNYGRQHHVQLKRLFQICMRFIGVASILIYSLAFLGRDSLIVIFSPAGTPVFDLAREGFLLFSISFLFAGFNMFTSALFTAFSNGKISATISFARTFLFILVALLLLPLLFEVKGIWLAVPFAELVSLFLAFFFIQRYKRTYHYL